MYTNILNLDRDAWMQQKLAMFDFRTLTSALWTIEQFSMLSAKFAFSCCV